MGALVQLAATALAVEPGKSVTTGITVRNTGSVVDRFSFEALGPAAAWVTFAPDTLSLFPEASGTVNVIIAPPRSSDVPAGVVPFGVKVVSAEDPAGGAAEEASLEVGAFSDVGAELLPRVVAGRRMGLARLAVDNRSNVPYDAQLSAADPSGALRFAFRPPFVSVPPGGAQIVRVRVHPVKTFWRGPSANKPFQMTLASETAPHPPTVPVDGSLLQEALLPKWVMALVAGLVALAALFAILWFTLFKPTIKSTATDAAKSQLAAAGITPGQASTVSSGGGGSGSSGGGGGGGSSSSPTTAGTSTAVAPGGTGTGSLTVNGSGVANGNGSQVIYTVPTGHALRITDLLIQNSAGDNGTLTLARNGSALMEWSMANFRDLDYHWVSPTLFPAGSKVVMNVTGCTNACHPALYYAGDLVTAS